MRQTIWLLLLLLLSACHKQNTKPTTFQVNPISSQNWQMSGKMSFSDGNEGGSGRIKWKEVDGNIIAKFTAPLGQGSWDLDERLGLIQNNKGQSWSGSNMGKLLKEQLGWEVPWIALKQSIKGLDVVNKQTKSGDSLVFYKQGWKVEWKKIKKVNGFMLPHKIYLLNEPYSVKIAVKTWLLD
ncbi:outer membrane lipoprotein LolB [Marinicella rhabdoformis]|uniref:outer membrane lipoprotein LolB n=1 Tax=Marinicella rhabdoformis TaxID=2580566 RepID=UPI0012AEE04B|nr:outer membrane lipoprotein LolB [Marinicella rhabdoformis]